jgi:hypothetical protein
MEIVSIFEYFHKSGSEVLLGKKLGKCGGGGLDRKMNDQMMAFGSIYLG